VVVAAQTSSTLTGYADRNAFDADQELLFKLSLVDSVDLLTSASQVNVTEVSFTARRRRLLASSVVVAYTLSDVRVPAATTATAAGSSLKSQLTTAFTTDSGSGTSPFGSSATTLAADTSVFASGTSVPTVDVTATLAAVDAVTVSLVKVSSAPPSMVPTPLPVPAVAAVPNTPKKDNSSSGDGGMAGLASTTNYFIVASVLGLLLGMCFAALHYSQKKKAAEAARAEEGAERVAFEQGQATKKSKNKNKGGEKRRMSGRLVVVKDDAGATLFTTDKTPVSLPGSQASDGMVAAMYADRTSLDSVSSSSSADEAKKGGGSGGSSGKKKNDRTAALSGRHRLTSPDEAVGVAYSRKHHGGGGSGSGSNEFANHLGNMPSFGSGGGGRPMPLCEQGHEVLSFKTSW